jgi:2-polyprenyl-3-methyl-5-hydroxy-6-metoxy-1,4-benzoquinol methylase
MKGNNRNTEIAQLRELDGRIIEKNRWTKRADYLLYLRHKKAYLYAADYCKEKKVLDYGCGNGYGSYLLSGVAEEVAAVDINGEVIDGCKEKYKKDNLTFQQVKPEERMHFEDRAFDVVISFQVVEHVLDVAGYLNELKRVLKDDGVLVITTPNRKHRLYPFQKPVNPFHMREYSLKALRADMGTVFNNVEIYGINGTAEVRAVEFRRLKKTMLRMFILRPIKRLLKPGFKKFSTGNNTGTAKKENNPPLKADILGKYSTDDYYIDQKEPNQGLDLIAVLRK